MEGVSAPAPYRIGERKEWIISDEPATAGFAILVRTAITNAERAELRARNDFIEGEYTTQYFEKPPEERDLHESPRVLQRRLLAPYIHAWNAEALTTDGEWKPVPPPVDAGADAFECILAPETAWILDVVLGGYYTLGKAVSLRSVSAAIGTTASEKPPDADPAPPPPTPTTLPKRRRSSATPSASASTT